MSASPSVAETWTTTFNNRYVYVSLAGAVGAVMFDLTTKLIAAGYTCKGSSSAGTAAMDATNRWTSAAAVTPRATIAGASQAWMVLTDGNGVDILFTYQGSADEKFRISFSATGVFVVAGTATFQPTAVDEAVTNNGNTLVFPTASGDRVWHTWISSDHKSFRCVVGRGGFAVTAFGQEKCTSQVFSPCTFTPNSVGHYASTTSASTDIFRAAVILAVSSSTCQGLARVHYGADITAVLGAATDGNALANLWVGSAIHELQGGDWPIQQLSWVSNTTSARGILGLRVDWWISKSTASSGDLPGTTTFTQIGDVVWPGDGSTTLTYT